MEWMWRWLDFNYAFLFLTQMPHRDAPYVNILCYNIKNIRLCTAMQNLFIYAVNQTWSLKQYYFNKVIATPGKIHSVHHPPPPPPPPPFLLLGGAGQWGWISCQIFNKKKRGGDLDSTSTLRGVVAGEEGVTFLGGGVCNFYKKKKLIWNI